MLVSVNWLCPEKDYLNNFSIFPWNRSIIRECIVLKLVKLFA